MVILPIDELDAGATLAALEEGVRRRRAAEVEDLLLVARWADLHSTDPRLDPRPVPGLPRPPGGDRLERVGGEGTPMIRELSLCELGVARGVHTLAARAAAADALDLRHRLPDTWRQVLSLRAEPWVARKVASLSRHLSAEVVHVVDEAVAAAIAGEAPSRVIAIAEAKVIEADQAAHDQRLRTEQQRRHVSLTRADATGLRNVIARVTAGDAAWVDAMITRVAEILATRPEHDGASRDLLRSEAFGWLARPADLLTLLLESGDVPAEVGDEPAEQGPDPDPEPVVPSRAVAVPADLLDALRTLDPARLRPRVRLYVHVHEAALSGMVAGVARVEDLGPHVLAQVRELLTHAHVTVKPVIDLRQSVSVNSYEHPEWLKERIHLFRPVDAFPHASRTSRNVDLDHPVPYDPDGPPGQTNSHVSQPLGRTAHRAKTHLGYRATPLPTGEMVWRTPHGRHRIVDPHGTHHLDPEEYDALVGDDELDRALARILHQHRTGQLPRRDGEPS
ncbi:MAG: hypothetical protein JWO76_111 [Nocardioides sp.]|nr:hypothetical protein [Nocardioides sp.]